ncbi:sensor histidine kinase [Ancylobacter sp. 6x-1]|uniref:histidine kinase n=1 Tax=Ancylobacter crimeensis TaxID=2579147 RepID=A0ABT0DFT1_9HYPH|nr:sensor histidine kinase [Ancylobacter crimeensis]MCK0198729.1 sensor histidine kinase [Ancylobacter crimeensis]
MSWPARAQVQRCFAHRLLETIFLGALCVLCAGHSLPCRADQAPRSILVLEQSDVRGPFYAAIFSGLRSIVNSTAKAPVTIYVENLDLNRFSGEDYEQSLRQHLNVKYKDKPIGVLVSVGAGALDYALRLREALWPGTPLVFSFIDEASLAAQTLPPGVTGQTVRLRLEDMVTAAAIIVPDLAHVALVGDRFDTQPVFRSFGAEARGIAERLDVIDLTGLPMTELLERVALLPERTAILYTAVYSDGRGTYFTPADAMAMIAAKANRPIIGPVESYIGRGTTGGFVAIPTTIGEQSGALALRIIDGETPSLPPVASVADPTPVFDWRELQRWGVDEARLPKGSDIRFRSPRIWQEYPLQIAGTIAVVVFQSGLIAALLYEYRRRRLAEVEARTRLDELAHVNRYAIAGELSASIAHQVNQPLGAVLANAEAAALLLDRPVPDRDEIREILDDIKRDGLRASGVIAGLRRMLKKADSVQHHVDLNQVLDETFRFVAAKAADAHVDLVRDPSPRPLVVHGDPVQLQQVVLNLAINAIEAIGATNRGSGKITGRVRSPEPGIAELSISDNGHGLPDEDRRQIFEAFYSSKPDGMGMGLSIARTIVERHGGSIMAESNPGGGSVFLVKLPLGREGMGAS